VGSPLDLSGTDQTAEPETTAQKRTELANDLFGFNIEQRNLIQVQLDGHFFTQMEQVFAVNSGDQVSGAGFQVNQ
jgi:hypothetical protein